MNTGDRKSSDDLIREARGRLDNPPIEPGDEAPDAGVEAEASPEPEPAAGLVFRSRAEGEKPAQLDEQAASDGSPVQPRESRGKKWITWAAIALALGAGIFLRGLGDASRDETGQIVGSGDVDVLDLRVGDCFNDPEEFEELVFDVAAVPCAEPHDNEVFAVDSVAGIFSDTFPGFAALDDYSFDFCSGDVFENFVGTHYFDSELEVYAFTPSEESWDQDDRGFTCVLYRLDFGKLTGSARNSGL